MKYKGFHFFELSQHLIQSNKLEQVSADSDNWLSFYRNQDSNWVIFYPFSEHHGGGQPYIINIGKNEFELWLQENPGFTQSIKESLL